MLYDIRWLMLIGKENIKEICIILRLFFMVYVSHRTYARYVSIIPCLNLIRLMKVTFLFHLICMISGSFLS